MTPPFTPEHLTQLDQRYLWHPFTQMKDWVKHEPIIIVEGHGAVLKDARGKEYLDANSSIWTNLHGHNQPEINAAIQRQLGRIAHSSALGLASEPASLLGERLVEAANPPGIASSLARVFFSDDGSTAIEVALKLAYEFTRRKRGVGKPRFLSLKGAYHGDTVGAVALGHIDLFHKAYAGLLFDTEEVMAPYCYRCPYNRAHPERADARTCRQCKWECIDEFEALLRHRSEEGTPHSAFVFEPLIQGAAGMIAQPEGWLGRTCALARQHGLLLIADEVMTGFGRTGTPGSSNGESEDHRRAVSLFASHQEGVQPDFLALAKGLTGGYLPMAATLTSDAVFEAFLGEYAEFKTFFHGHSYTANQLGAAAALASLSLLESADSLRHRSRLETVFDAELQTLWNLEAVGDVRRVGLVAGIELVKDWRTREPFPLDQRAGIRVCEQMAELGVLTRPIGNVIALMPPYCATEDQLSRMVEALRRSVAALKRL